MAKNLHLGMYFQEIPVCYISRMSDNSRNEQPVRVVRDGLPEPPDKDWSIATPEERIEAV